MKEYTHISTSERIEIEKMHKGFSIRQIARRLGRNPSTISRELRRNGKYSCELLDSPSLDLFDAPLKVHDDELIYVAESARTKAQARAIKSHEPYKSRNDRLVAIVVDSLRMGWTPEILSGVLKRKYPNDSSINVSTEWIYKFIYSKQMESLRLHEYLPRAHKKRRKKNGRRVHSSHIPQRVSIHKRPQEIDERTQFGHFEGDSIEGLRSVGDGIHTEVERVSRFLLATKVSKINSDDGIEAQIRLFSTVDANVRRSTTLDNGREHHRHFELNKLGMDTYFADPYSSFQRGTNERTNGMIRRYLPKRTDFRTISEQELQEIVWEINNRPMKCLGYLSPSEVYNMEIEKARCVALQN